MRRIRKFSRTVLFGGISELKIGGFGQLSVLLHTQPTGQLGAGHCWWTEDPYCWSAKAEGKSSYFFFPRCSCGYQEKVSAEEAGSGVKAKAQPKVASSKRAKVSSVEAPRAAPVPVSPSPLVVPPPSTALSSAGSEGRIAEAGSSAEGAGPVPQVEEAQGRSTSEVDNRTKVASTPFIPTETLGPEKEVAEDAAPMAKSPTAETPAEKNDQGGNATMTMPPEPKKMHPRYRLPLPR
ncbi:hypothetical protein Pyn_29426 [Prunus yedoensis var. nudiflora]|uniref:Uncharacterized protein n=1 Tax=Prunus yedoensis var. nudiflora TaxID=2094558 RepID=A0A314UQN0_PRUYE|nr:hypothetical protein Pyn_29426 [Prunus yedoensis var. nudiflora]